MQKFKTFLYYASIILPIFKKIGEIISFFVEFNKTNKEVIQARDDLKSLLKNLNKAQEDFNKIMED